MYRRTRVQMAPEHLYTWADVHVCKCTRGQMYMWADVHVGRCTRMNKFSVDEQVNTDSNNHVHLFRLMYLCIDLILVKCIGKLFWKFSKYCLTGLSI